MLKITYLSYHIKVNYILHESNNNKLNPSSKPRESFGFLLQAKPSEYKDSQASFKSKLHQTVGVNAPPAGMGDWELASVACNSTLMV